jgi:hypothetical protein
MMGAASSRNWQEKHSARLGRSASPFSKSNKLKGTLGQGLALLSIFEERSKDADNQLEQINHHVASLSHLSRIEF